MNLLKVQNQIKKIESELEKQGIIKDAFLEDHLDQLKQIAAELIEEQSNKKDKSK